MFPAASTTPARNLRVLQKPLWGEGEKGSRPASLARCRCPTDGRRSHQGVTRPEAGVTGTSSSEGMNVLFFFFLFAREALENLSLCLAGGYQEGPLGAG